MESPSGLYDLVNSIAFLNGTSGISSNSDPAIIVENCTSFANRQSNFNLYGKGAGERSFQVRNCLSMAGGSADVYREMPALARPDNYFWNGARSLNSLGQELTPAIFRSADASTVPGRRPDGSIDMKGFLLLNERAPAEIGARLE